MSTETLLWIIFGFLVIGMLALDLMVFHRKQHTITIREALKWTFFWITLALLFDLGIYFWQGSEGALNFLTAYLIEKSLSVDNLFVFMLIFTYFGVPSIYQHNVLFWGILGALIMRGILIASGIALVDRFDWVFYVFGAFLIFMGIRTMFEKDKQVHPEKNPAVRLLRRFMPIVGDYENGKFFVKRATGYAATLLFVVVLVVETTDVVFALDSIPAVFAITVDPFIVYTSNIFAILGLRALYFALAGLIRVFHYLHYGVSAILVFVGVKMVLSDILHMPVSLALGVIAVILSLAVIASVIRRRRSEQQQLDTAIPEEPEAA